MGEQVLYCSGVVWVLPVTSQPILYQFLFHNVNAICMIVSYIFPFIFIFFIIIVNLNALYQSFAVYFHILHIVVYVQYFYIICWNDCCYVHWL